MPPGLASPIVAAPFARRYLCATTARHISCGTETLAAQAIPAVHAELMQPRPS